MVVGDQEQSWIGYHDDGGSLFVFTYYICQSALITLRFNYYIIIDNVS